MRQRWLRWVGLLLCLLLVLGGEATAVFAASDPPDPIPLPPAEPTEVAFLVVLLDIPTIDVIDQTFTIEGTLALEWVDPRLAFDPAVEGLPFLMYTDDNATDKLNSIWNPSLEFENARGPRDVTNAFLGITETGEVYYQERFSATLATPLDLREFPFDEQILNMTVSSFNYPTSQMLFAEQSQIILSPNLALAEWQVSDPAQVALLAREPYGFSLMPPGMEPTADDLYATAVFSIPLERQPTYYIWKLLIPVFIITAISWISFWLEPTVGERINMTFSSMLTVVAYSFVVATTLPPINYLTRLDKVLILTYVFVAVIVVQHGVAAYWYGHGREEATRKLDRTSRWLIPLLYLIFYLGFLWL
jgi:hypothetical protein